MGRVEAIQNMMARENIDVYLVRASGRLSWVSDAFCPWRSYVFIPAEGLPTVFHTLSSMRPALSDESWLDEDHVLGFAPVGGMDQITH
jgi:spore maturation protein SpmB